MAATIPTVTYGDTSLGALRCQWTPAQHYQLAYDALPQQFKKDPYLNALLFGGSACAVVIGYAYPNPGPPYVSTPYKIYIEKDDGTVSSVAQYSPSPTDDVETIASRLILIVNALGIGVEAILSEVSSDKFYIRSIVSGEKWTYYSLPITRKGWPVRVYRLGIISEIAFAEELLWDLFPSILMFYPEKWGQIEEIRNDGSGNIEIKSTDHGLAATKALWDEETSPSRAGVPLYIGKTDNYDTEASNFGRIVSILDDDHFVVDTVYSADEDKGIWMYPGDVDRNRGRAQGTQLDLAGSILRVPRLEDELDANYILALMAKVHCDSSSGTIPDMLDALSMLYPNADIFAENLCPAAVRMKVIDDPGKYNGRIKMMRDTQPTGVGLSINTVSSSNPFRMALQGIITLYADNGAGGTTVTSAAHAMADGDTVTISESHAYDGSYVILNVTTDTYDIAIAYAGSYYYLTTDLWIRTARADGMGGFGDSTGTYTDGGELSSVWVSP